jgi:hypothetical protein
MRSSVSDNITSPGPATTNSLQFSSGGRTFRPCRRCGRFRVFRDKDRFFGWTCADCLAGKTGRQEGSRRTGLTELWHKIDAFVDAFFERNSEVPR